MQLKNHRMLVTLSGKSVYIIGGQDIYHDEVDTILEMRCPHLTPDSCYFKKINVTLKHSRYGHMAIPINQELATKMCF